MTAFVWNPFAVLCKASNAPKNRGSPSSGRKHLVLSNCDNLGESSGNSWIVNMPCSVRSYRNIRFSLWYTYQLKELQKYILGACCC